MPADLKKGSKGKAVKDLQTFLGMEPASIDGNFGDGTTAALNSWKKSLGLPEDGIVDSQTRILIAYQKFAKVSLEQAIDLDEIDYEGIESYAEQTGIINSALNTTADQTATNVSQVASENLLEGLVAPLPKSIVQSTPTETTEMSDFMAGLAGLDSLFKTQTQPAVSNATSQVINNTTVANAVNTYNQANQTNVEASRVVSNANTNLAMNAETVIANQNSAIQQLNNLQEYLNPAVITTIQNKEAAIKEATTRLESSNIAQMTERTATVNQDKSIESARVESSELISQSETAQIIRPVNPVVQSVDSMKTQVSTAIQNVGSDLSKTVSTIKNGDQINTSNVTQVDQSSIYTAGKPEKPMTESIAQAEDKEVRNYNNRMNDATLNAIYELLAGGIKVKLSS